MKALLWIIPLFFSIKSFSHDTLTVKKSRIIKVAVLRPLLLANTPKVGVYYAGASFEKYRNHKTSFNFYLDYFFIEKGSFNNTGFYRPTLQDWPDEKHIISLRFLYKRYLFNNSKYFKGFYLAAGLNVAERIINYSDWVYLEPFHFGYGIGLGYQVIINKRISLEFLHHKAFNGMFLFPSKLDEPSPIGVILSDITIGYTF